MKDKVRIPCQTQEVLKPTFRCGQCGGLEKERLVNDKESCSKLGIIATSAVCNNFKPDISSLFDDIDSLEPLLALSKVLQYIKTNDLDMVAALIQGEKRTRKQKLRFGQRVYVRYIGQSNSNYVSNFMSAFVLDARSNYVRVRSRDGSFTMTFEGQNGLNGPTVYSKQAFDELQEKMRKNNKYLDPYVKILETKRARSIEEYHLGLTKDIAKRAKDGEIPTMDTVFKENGLKNNKAYNDLVDIVRDIERGFNASKTGSSSYRNKSTRKKSKSDADEVIVIG